MYIHLGHTHSFHSYVGVVCLTVPMAKALGGQPIEEEMVETIPEKVLTAVLMRMWMSIISRSTSQ